jgi:hypothetical protein
MTGTAPAPPAALDDDPPLTAMLVVDDGRRCGVVTAADVVRLLARRDTRHRPTAR